MPLPHLTPALRIRLLQRGLAEGLWTHAELDLDPESDPSGLSRRTWLGRFDRLEEEGRIPESLALRVVEEAEDTTLFPTSAPPADPFPPGARDRFENLGLLGDGGMGTVFKARDRQMGRVVALKLLKLLDAEGRSRFLQEIRSQARIEHPHIVQVFEAGEFDGRPYLAMQYVDGPTLKQALSVLNLEQKAAIVRDAAEALHACHRMGILHRDIKPSNIMLDAAEDGHWHAYVMDFGLARDPADPSQTQPDILMGTPAYLSPEQARRLPLDRRSDVYALGTTLYEALGGAPPFSHTDTWELMRRIAQDDPRPLHDRVPDLPRDLELIVAKAMEKTPLRRYETARAMAEDLTRFLEGDPVLAQAPSPLYRLRKRARKHRALVALGAVSAALVLALGIFGVRMALRSSRVAALGQRFGAHAGQIEFLLFKAYTLPLHDTSPERRLVRQRMDELRLEMERSGGWAAGPGHQALGRGYMALDRPEEARAELEWALRAMPGDPGVEQALGLVLARLYHRELEGLWGKAREARRKEVERTLRAPALALLHRTGGRGLDAPAYAEAEIALVEGWTEEALAQVRESQRQAPWFHPAWVLEGDLFRDRAAGLQAQGHLDAAEQALESARKAYEHAIDIARSAPDPYLGEARRRNQLLNLHFERGHVRPEEQAWALEPIAQARVADPSGWQSFSLASAIHRRWSLLGAAGSPERFAELDRAIGEARSGLQLNPDHEQLLNNLGTSLRSKAEEEYLRGRDPRPTLRAAEGALERALLQPRLHDFLLDSLGNCHALEGQYELYFGLDPRASLERAARYLEESNGLRSWVGHLTGLGRVLVFLAEDAAWRGEDPTGHLGRAEAVLKQALQLNPNSYQARVCALQALIQGARWRLDRGLDPGGALEEAALHGEKARTLRPDLPEAAQGLALVALLEARAALRLGRPPEAALERARGLLRALPPSPESILAQGEGALVAALGSPRKGLAETFEALGRELAARPWDGRLWFLKGRLLEASGRSAEAEGAYAEALRRNPNLRPLRPGTQVPLANLAADI